MLVGGVGASSSTTDVWTADESRQCDALLDFLRLVETVSLDDLHFRYTEEYAVDDPAALQALISKMQRFPRVFEIYDAQGTLDQYNLDGRMNGIMVGQMADGERPQP